MLVALTFRCKPGKEAEFRALLDDPSTGQKVARFMGSPQNTLFIAGRTMIRILDIPDGAPPRSLVGLAQQDPAFKAFLLSLAAVMEDKIDPLDEGQMAAFMKAHMLPLVYDVGPDGPRTAAQPSQQARSATH